MFAFITGNGKKRARESSSSGGGGWFGGEDNRSTSSSSGGNGNVQASSSSSAGAASTGGNNRHLSDIERKRRDSIRENQEFMKQLGLTDVSTGMREEPPAPAAAAASSAPSPIDGNASRQARGGGPSSFSSTPPPTLEQVKAKWVGREAQIKLLARLLPSIDDPCSSSSVLLVHGPSGGGKTGVVADVLRSLKLPHALIRGVEHPTARSLYSTIAATWLRHVEMQAQALGLEGVGYMEVDEYDDEQQREESVFARRARTEARQRRRQRRQRKQGAGGGGGGKEGEGGEGEGEEDEEGSSIGGSESDEEDEDEEEDEEEEEEDPYYAQRSSVQQASAGAAGAVTGTNLIPLPNRCATAAGLLHLLRSWRGCQQQQQQISSQEGFSEGAGAAAAAGAGGTMPFVIVLDSADRLPRGSSLVRHELVELPAMLAGPRGKGSDRGWGGAGAVVALTVILISETPVVVPGTLEAALALDVPFPAYSKVQATAILLRSLRVAAGLPPSSSSSSGVEGGREDGGEEEFELLVAGFVNVLVASLYSSTRDVREMRRMAVLLSEKYLEPVLAEVGREGGREEEVVEEEEGQENQAGRRNSSSSGWGGGREGGRGGGTAPGHLALFERVRPLIQRAVHSCLHMPAEPLEKANSSLPSLPPSSSSSTSSTTTSQQQQQHQALLRHELPKMALYLLLASFLASHVSPDTDLQLFAVKSSSSSSPTTTRGTKRNKRTATAEERAAELQEAEGEKEGARAFSLERLLSIFTCLVALTRASGAAYANNTGTTELFAQINTLVRHRLLLRVRGGSGELGGMKFKCNVDEGLVRVVATELEVALGQYLERGARG